MESSVAKHDHNGQYVRQAECTLMRENLSLELRDIKRLTWFILGFQVMTVGGAIMKWLFR
jgi:hypothetical protein